MNKMVWEFFLEDKQYAVLDSDKSAEEMARELMAQPADGYVYDEWNVIPVRRVIHAHRVVKL